MQNTIHMNSARSEREDTFIQAFGNKPGSDRRRERRQRKGWKY